ncbi:MAG: metallopeptidase family protein [Desulfuromonadaceae bacterium]
MTRRDFERLVARAIHMIPDEFLRRVDNLSFQIEDWADAETLNEAGLRDPRDLLGHYRGCPLPERTHQYQDLADVITIYQQAVEDCHRRTGTGLLRIVGETVLHELAHYFGFDEEAMDEIEQWWQRTDGDGIGGPGDS